MNNITIYAVILLGSIGAIAAIILYIVAKKFKVEEDPKVAEVEDVLPGANCGACGFAGCHAMAEALVKTKDVEHIYCPVGGSKVMTNIGSILGLEISDKEPQIAVVCCNGSKQNAPEKVEYDGALTCEFANMLFSGESGCPYGCLGLGDCVEACNFDAIYMDEITKLPVVNEENCVACGACVNACPRDIIELRNKGRKNKRVYVSCINKEKGGVARKNCKVACIGCGKCVEVCKFDAITIENDLAYIDFNKCMLCRKCVEVCPTGAIRDINFPPKKPKVIQKEKTEVTDIKK